MVCLPQVIAIAGSTGFLGSHLCAFLRSQGHTVLRLVRHKPQQYVSSDIYWNPDSGHIETHGLEGVQIAINLCGANVAERRWSATQKKYIRDSRIKSTQLLSHAISKLLRPPRLLISSSATGYYGNRENEVVEEDSPRGAGFLPDLCADWEQASAEAKKKGLRVCHARTGIVLSPDGGVLKELLPLFRVGLGGPIGSGEQYLSWVSLTDWIQAILHIINTESLEGPVNITAPNAVTNREFTHTLGRVLNRPTALAIPAFAIKFIFGEMGETLFLEGNRAIPKRLTDSGFQFAHPDLEIALRFLLNRSK